mmetsp:Transcript_24105/g.37845  ORF Transcript_24105/g.37845 Transcript_24105/m.37845 type:complete len:284 (-) Transcript_24105:377-1228(-)
MNRLKAVKRLLESLVDSDYIGHTVDLDIKIDHDTKKRSDWREVILLSQGFNWPHGEKNVILEDQNRGLAYQFTHAWTPPEDNKEYAMILEDDNAVSPMWYRWVRRMWEHYGHLPHIAAVTLQHHSLCPRGGASKPIVNNNEPFAFRLLGSWGFGPSPTHWRMFQAEGLDVKDPSVPGLITTSWYNLWKTKKPGSMWTQHYIYMSHHKGWFTIYLTPNSRESMVANYREAGEHYDQSQGADFRVVSKWKEAWDTRPAKLNYYDWGCEKLGSPHGVSPDGLSVVS